MLATMPSIGFSQTEKVLQTTRTPIPTKEFMLDRKLSSKKMREWVRKHEGLPKLPKTTRSTEKLPSSGGFSVSPVFMERKKLHWKEINMFQFQQNRNKLRSKKIRSTCASPY
jgi:hypothetical protein